MKANRSRRNKLSALVGIGAGWACALAVAAALLHGTATAQAPVLQQMDIVLRSVSPGPIARVNGESIPSREFIDMYLGEIDMIERIKGAPLTDAERVATGMRTLGLVVEREVMLQEARARGVAVSPEEVEAAWRRELDELTESMRRRGVEGPTEAQVLERAGVSREEALEELRDALIVERLRAQLTDQANVQVDEAEVRRRFEERKDALRQPERIHLQQIFIAKPPAGGDAARAEARQRADAALQRIRAGQRFEAVTRDVSEGSLAQRGGDPGPLPADRLPPFMVAAAQAMNPGEVSEVIESEAGFHILRLEEILHGEEPDFNRFADIIRADMRAREGARIAKEFVSQRIDSGDYEIRTFLDIDRQLLAHPEIIDELRAGAGEP